MVLRLAVRGPMGLPLSFHTILAPRCHPGIPWRRDPTAAPSASAALGGAAPGEGTASSEPMALGLAAGEPGRRRCRQPPRHRPRGSRGSGGWDAPHMRWRAALLGVWTLRDAKACRSGPAVAACGSPGRVPGAGGRAGRGQGGLRRRSGRPSGLFVPLPGDTAVRGAGDGPSPLSR